MSLFSLVKHRDVLHYLLTHSLYGAQPLLRR